jgi:phosphoenolpyruvate synthase/pyruvate phosphate dikinase
MGNQSGMGMIRSFDELTPEQQTSAGGKAGTLARLYQAGYPVPDGFVILPAAFAIRSSALSEDSARASFAGEFETVLDVHTHEQVREAVLAVRRSLRSLRVGGGPRPAERCL